MRKRIKEEFEEEKRKLDEQIEEERARLEKEVEEERLRGQSTNAPVSAAGQRERNKD